MSPARVSCTGCLREESNLRDPTSLRSEPILTGRRCMNTPSSPPRRQRRPTPRAGFWELHDLLFAHQDALSPDDLYRFAAELSLDVERISEELRTRRHAPRVARDVDSADQSSVAGTPTFFINGRRHCGAYDLDTLTGSVEGEAIAAGGRGRPG